jgi:hypothetical protein
VVQRGISLGIGVRLGSGRLEGRCIMGMIEEIGIGGRVLPREEEGEGK